ncbi:MAG TPA: hypothetical protein VFZ32_05475 [Micromonosporaceae bacterium]
MSHDKPGVAPAVLDQIAQLLAETPCQHCGRPPYQSDHSDPTVADLDRIDTTERRYWRQVAEAAKVHATAPPEPSREKLEAARTAFAQARQAEEALHEQINDAEDKLADPRAWLRPGQRITLAGQLTERRNAIEAVREQVTRAERRLRDLERQRDRRSAHLARYQRVLDAGRRAQEELDRRVDQLVHAYAKLPVPPPWFTLGLGYPPKPEQYPTWLRRTRAVVAYRRRYGIDHPLEPLGRGEPPEDTPQHEHWRAAQR